MASLSSVVTGFLAPLLEVLDYVALPFFVALLIVCPLVYFLVLDYLHFSLSPFYDQAGNTIIIYLYNTAR